MCTCMYECIYVCMCVYMYIHRGRTSLCMYVCIHQSKKQHICSGMLLATWGKAREEIAQAREVDLPRNNVASSNCRASLATAIAEPPANRQRVVCSIPPPPFVVDWRSCEARGLSDWRCELVKQLIVMYIQRYSQFRWILDSSPLTPAASPPTPATSSSRLAGIASWLDGVSSWLAGVSSWLAEVSSWLAGVSSWLAGVSSWLAGVSSWLAAVSYFPFPICVTLNAAPSVPYFPLPIRCP